MATDTDLAKLSVQLELQTAAFEAGVKQMDRQLKKMDDNTKRSAKGMDKLNKSVKTLGKSFAGLATGLTAGALVQASKEAIEYGDNIAKTADKVGVTAAELQELRFAAGQAGIETRTLDMALQRFARRMGEAAKGTGELLKTTQELGIQFQDDEGRYFSTTELLEQYADAMGRAETQQEKLRLAFKAFDSEGAALVNLLGDGSEEMKALRQQAVELGLVMSTDLTKVSEGLNDQLEILSTQLKTKLSSALVTATYKFADFFGLLANQTDTTRMAFLASEIENLRQEIVKLDSGEMRGGNIYIRERAFKIAELSVEYNELREKLGLTTEATKEETAAANANAQAQVDRLNAIEAYSAEVAKFVQQTNPMNELAKTLGYIDAALRSTTDPATIERLWDLREAAEFGDFVDPEDVNNLASFDDKVKEFIGTLNDEANDAAEYLGIMYAALEQLTDPALRAKVEDMIEAFTFGEDDLDPDPIIGYLDKIEESIDGFARDFSNTLVEGLKTGELAFDDFAKNVLETIAKMMLNDIFTQFFEILYGGIKSYFNIGTTSAGSGDTRLGTLGRVALPTDGMARAGETSTAMVGTVVARASPKGTSAAGQVTVNVNNYGNDEVSVTERQDSNGGIDIDVLIKQKVNSGFARGDFDKMLGSSFGLRRLGY